MWFYTNDFVLFLSFQMGEPPYYVCRRCRSASFFWDYQSLRRHLRIFHRIEVVPKVDLVLYEMYPGARFQAPKVRGNVDAGVSQQTRGNTDGGGSRQVRSGVNDSNNVQVTVGNTRNQRFRINEGASGSGLSTTNVIAASNAGSVLSTASANAAVNAGNVGLGNVVRAGVNENSQSNNADVRQQNADVVVNANTNVQRSDSLTLEHIENMIERQVADRVEVAVRRRISLMNAEIEDRLHNALENEVPTLVSDTLVGIARHFISAGDEEGSSAMSPRSRFYAYVNRLGLRANCQQSSSDRSIIEKAENNANETRVNSMPLADENRVENVAHNAEVEVDDMPVADGNHIERSPSDEDLLRVDLTSVEVSDNGNCRDRQKRDLFCVICRLKSKLVLKRSLKC